MKISKSKRQLAQLLIEAGVTQFPEGANWAAQCRKGEVSFWGEMPTKEEGYEWCGGDYLGYHASTSMARKIPNWHQTVLSRDEFDQIVADTVVVSEPKVPSEKTKAELTESAGPAPVLDQLLQDWRNADDYAQRKQTEADEAAAMRDERWKAVQARAGEMGVTVARCEPELVINDWRDLRVGDIIKVTGFDGADTISDRWLQLLDADSCTVVAADGTNVQIERTDMSAGRCEGWCLNGVLKTQWRFIRRP